MKKKNILIILLALLISITNVNGVKASSNIVVGISAQSKPYNYYSEDGKLTGFEIELLEEIDKRLEEYQFTYKTTEFASLFAGLDASTFDLIANNIGEKEERREKYLFSLYPYVITHNVIITKPELGENISLKNLAGKKIGVVAGSTQAIFLEKYNKENIDKKMILEFIDADGPSIIREVDNGRIDATIYSTTYLNDVNQTFGLKLKGHKIENEDAIQPPGAYILYRKDEKSVKLRNKIDEVLEEMRKDGFLASISKKYFNNDDTVLTEQIIQKNDKIEANRISNLAIADSNKKSDETKTNDTSKVNEANKTNEVNKANKNTEIKNSSDGKIFVPDMILQNIPPILEALPITLLMALVSAFIGLILGFLIAIIKIRKIPVLRQIATIFVSFMRGTPQLVQLFLAYYGFPLLVKWLNVKLGMNADINSIPAIIYVFIAFGLNEAAYTSEIFRSAILSVDEAEIEAAKSIGLTNFQTVIRIILPSALIVALPNLGNSLISLLKSTSLAFTVTVVDIMGKSRIIAGSNLRFFESYIAVALIYWACCLIIEFLFKLFENKLNVDKA